MTQKNNKIVCLDCGCLNIKTETDKQPICQACGSSIYFIPPFKNLWAQGRYDDCKYYVLVADVSKWSSAGISDYLAETIPPVTGESKGIVTYKYCIYIYSNLKMAEWRANFLGIGVEPFQLNCLSCFYHVASGYMRYLDSILDECWHISIYTCRESNYNYVSHIKLDDRNDYFQLVGCSHRKNLAWEPCLPYNNLNHPPEYCRPVYYPFSLVLMQDHTKQDGPLDIEFLTPADCLSYFSILGETFALHPFGLLARPIGTLAFAKTMGEKIVLTRGNGIWIPIAFPHTGPQWTIYPWAKGWSGYVEEFSINPQSAETVALDKGPELLLNECFANLEAALQSDKINKDELTKINNKVDSVLEISPGHYIAKELKSALTNWPPELLDALIYSDKILTHLAHGNYEKAIDCGEKALAMKKDCVLALI